MRVFARLWDRIPGREAAPGTLAVLGVLGLLLGHAGAIAHLVGATGWIWN